MGGLPMGGKGSYILLAPPRDEPDQHPDGPFY
jgi:hypothetical protein